MIMQLYLDMLMGACKYPVGCRAVSSGQGQKFFAPGARPPGSRTRTERTWGRAVSKATRRQAIAKTFQHAGGMCGNVWFSSRSGNHKRPHCGFLATHRGHLVSAGPCRNDA